MVTEDSTARVQLRPSIHFESNVRVCPTRDIYVYPSGQVSAFLPEFVAWNDMRLVMALTMKTSVGYDEAVKFMRLDSRHISFSIVTGSLIWMQCKCSLDETHWTKYILETYFKMVVMALEHRLSRGMYPRK